MSDTKRKPSSDDSQVSTKKKRASNKAATSSSPNSTTNSGSPTSAQLSVTVSREKQQKEKASTKKAARSSPGSKPSSPMKTPTESTPSPTKISPVISRPETTTDSKAAETQKNVAKKPKLDRGTQKERPTSSTTSKSKLESRSGLSNSKRTSGNAFPLRDEIFFPLILTEDYRNRILQVVTYLNILALIPVGFSLFKAYKLYDGENYGDDTELRSYFIKDFHSSITFTWTVFILSGFGVALEVGIIGISSYFKSNEQRYKAIKCNFFQHLVRAIWWALIILGIALIYFLFMESFSMAGYKQHLISKMGSGKGKKGSGTKVISYIQRSQMCCGSSKYSDWSDIRLEGGVMEVFRRCPLQQLIKENNDRPYIPPSCCNENSIFACSLFAPAKANDSTPLFDSKIDTENDDYLESDKFFAYNHYTRGCYEPLSEAFNGYIDIVFSCYAALFAVQLFNFIAVTYFVRSMEFSVHFLHTTRLHGYSWLFGPDVEQVDLARLAASSNTWNWWKFRVHCTPRLKRTSSKTAEAQKRQNLEEILKKIKLTEDVELRNGTVIGMQEQKHPKSKSQKFKVTSEIIAYDMVKSARGIGRPILEEAAKVEKRVAARSNRKVLRFSLDTL